MYDVMEGVRVVEVAEHTFVPAAAMTLADWGADVIKIERTTGGGDPMRTLPIPNLEAGGYNPFYEAANRGKRSLALDLQQQEGRDILYKLVKDADVFTTNLREDARVKLGIEPEELMKINPKLIYVRGTGYGRQGPFAAQGGFDNPSMWVRGGLSYLASKPGQEPPSAPTSVGDLAGGIISAGAIAGALFRRERTGKGAIIDNALYAVGTYINSQIIAMASMGVNREPQNVTRENSFSPLVMMYRTKDDRWVNLCLLMPHWWPDFCRHLDRDDLITDARFADPQARYVNRGALISELDAIFSQRTLAEWVKRLETMEGVWAPCFSPAEVAADPQALINGFVVPVGESAEAPDYMIGSTPCQFDEKPVGMLKRGPGYGEHSDEILAEIGIAGDRLDSLRQSRVIV